MFPTFTGNSRRPRNVNLSGSSGNPFSNTSWTPSTASNTTRTVTDAQAEREKRHRERLRVRAAGKIQQTWRGHKSRKELSEDRRVAFDGIFGADGTQTWAPEERVILSSSLLVFFFNQQREDDIPRVLCFIRDALSAGIDSLVPPRVSAARTHQVLNVLVKSLQTLASQSTTSNTSNIRDILSIFSSLMHNSPPMAVGTFSIYYDAMERFCRPQDCRDEMLTLLPPALSIPLQVSDKKVQNEAYTSLAFDFMTKSDISVFESNIGSFSENIDVDKLSEAIIRGYTSGRIHMCSRDALLHLLAHFIDFGRRIDRSSKSLTYFSCLHTQVTFLSSDITLRTTINSEELATDTGSKEHVEQYVTSQLKHLVGADLNTRLVADFSLALMDDSRRDKGATLLAGYILSILRTFPENADDTRMKLFLQKVPTPGGDVPMVKYLWAFMLKTSVFQDIINGSAEPIEVLRSYVLNSTPTAGETPQEHDWTVIRLFLELYTFVLRLSDDEDFFSGIYPSALQNQASSSWLQSCSLSLQDVKALTSFLKVMAFTFHYRAHEISKTQQELIAATTSRLTSYLGSGQVSEHTMPETKQQGNKISLLSNIADINGLRDNLTTAVKMLYERDSRKPFLPPSHWLMKENFVTDDFTHAVILEEQQQREAEDGDEENEEEDEDAPGSGAGGLGGAMGSQSSYIATRLSSHARQERMKAQHKSILRERRRAEMGPKLEILRHMPFVVPFDTRVLIFRQFVELDRSGRDAGSPFRQSFSLSRHHGQIRRGQVFEDAFQAFEKLGDGLKDHIQITFVDQFGAPEAGIDGGGVTKEFLTSITTEAFGNEDGGLEMFSSSEKGLLYPNPAALDILREALRDEGYSESDQEWRDALTNLLKRYEFLGRIIGKCMYEGILVDLAFAGFFLLKWPSSGPNQDNTYKGSVNDLRDLDDDLYKGMLHLKNYNGVIADLGFDFTIEDQASPSQLPVKTINRKLIPDGDLTPVTNDNRLLYIFHVARHRLVVQPAAQTAAFLRGLRAIIRPSWLSMFNQSELQRLVGGDSSEIDVEDLRKNTYYSGLYEIGDDGQEHPTIQLFWKVMHEFTDVQRRDVIKYVSSTPRAPLLGFSQLRPKFSIRDSGADQTRLPSTSTCVNLLKLPMYKSEKVLREKLLYAVQSGAGFDLS